MTFDTATIVFISILVDFALVLILLHTWRTRTTYPGFRTWIAGTACWSVGSTLTLLLFNLQPQFIPKILGNTLIMLHPLLLYVGIQKFYGIRSRWWGTPLNLILVLLFLVNQCYYFYVHEHMGARIIVISLVLTLLFTRVALEPLLYARARSNSMQWLLSLSLLPLIFLLALRFWFFYATGSAPDTVQVNLNEDTLLRWLMIYGIIVELMIAYSYLSLTSGRVEEELQQSEKSYRELSATLQTRVEVETTRRMVQERQLSNHSRLAAMGEMINAIAHQWRQPLATLGMMVQRTYAVGTTQGLTPESLSEFKTSAMRQIHHMSDTIEEFRGFYRPDKQRVLFSPATCVTDSLRLLESHFTSSGIRVDLQVPLGEILLVEGFPNEFKQVILNLLGNARDAILGSRSATGAPAEGWILVLLANGADDNLWIDIRDNGPGIPTSIAPRIFDPYFTTKEESGGSGIGLYMSKMIVNESLGGHLSLLSGEAGATTFRIELPLRRPV
ncbi:MAG: hypothetical protein CVU69_08655 [Deltaproteobacteria bacterium HGW-Deltaproteobacteria-4]|nr:MAG: hypothetical protein CVU69_08655 [Deltaproteobacteria bacterium HGW-Deltaproteobacteria-4]